MNDQFQVNEENVFKILNLIIDGITSFNNILDTYISENKHEILGLLKQGKNFNETILCEVNKNLNNCLNEVVIIIGNILLKYYSKQYEYENRKVVVSYTI